ncbi:MAG: RimK/LysX family protein [Bacteroidota bacterium]
MSPQATVGWREWVAFPDLGLPAVHVKVDTGARTSALHARDIERIERDGQSKVRFVVDPLFGGRPLAVPCEAAVVDEREVTSSSGATERRVVIQAMLRLGIASDAPEWPVQVTLTDRRGMRFPMLLGREAMAGRVLVDPGASYRLGHLERPGVFYDTAGA